MIESSPTGSRELLSGVRHIVWEKGGRVVTVCFDGGASMSFDINRNVSGTSHGNLEYAVIESKLFDFYLLNEEVLHIICPFTEPETKTLGVWLRRIAKGHIQI